MAKLTKLTFEINGKDYVLHYDDAYQMYLELDKIFSERAIKCVIPATTRSMGVGPTEGMGGGLTKQYDQSAFYYGENNTSSAYAPQITESDTITFNIADFNDEPKTVIMSDRITLGDNAFDMANRPKSAYSVF